MRTLPKYKYSITHINSYFITSSLHGELISALDTMGVRQQVFIPVQKASFISKKVPNKLVYSHLFYNNCFNRIDRYLWPLKMVKIWQEFKKHFESNPTTLLHAHTLIVNGLIAYWTHKKWDVPYALTIRNTDLNVFINRNPLFKLIALRVLNHANKIITMSPAYRDIQLTRFFSKNKYPSIYKKCVGIPNGINDYWLQNRQKKAQRQSIATILYSGRVDKNKNLALLIAACQLLEKQKYRFRLKVLGDGPLLSRIRSKEYGFPVEYFGHLSDKSQILEILRQSDVLVVPSVTESFGLVYPEAMSQGLPVIYTRGQGFDGHFSDGYVGFSVNPQDINEIVEKIKMIFSDYEHLSINAYKASSDFSWEKVAVKLVGVYNSITKDHQ